VKFLEFALHGAVPVVQDLAPYRATVRDSKTGVLFGDPDSLIAALDHLAASPETRAAIADNAGAYVERERNQAAAGAQRLAFYRELLPFADAGRAAHAEQVMTALAGGDGVVSEGRHLQLGFGDYEELIRRALELGHAARSTEALGLLNQAAAQEPLAYQPWAFSALFATRDRRTAYLRQALACNPSSLSSWIDLGDLLDADGDPDAALRAYTSAAEVDPTFDLPYAKTSLLLGKLGRPVEAQQFGAIAHQIQQPFVS
jgi:tetratricopeptide (TPR) repeat protein